MIQNVSSATPLEKVDYHLRDDGLADIRIRRSIRTVTHHATDSQPEYVEYTAVESYQVLAAASNRRPSNRRMSCSRVTPPVPSRCSTG